VLIASAGSVWVFALNAVLSVASGFVVLRWRREHTPSPLGREKLISAMRVGVQFVRQSQRMRAVLSRVSIFFFHSTALLALLPLLARNLQGGGAGTFTLLLAAMGAGAIVAVLFLPRLRQALGRDQLVLRGTLLQSAATAVMAFAPNAWVAVPAMFFGGMAWITVANSLSCRPSSRCPTGCARAACRCTRWPSWARAPSAPRSGARWPPSATSRSAWPLPRQAARC
jgi:predicted MFS family arabinose efflux permease